jgi:hypothetical protein
MRSSIFLLCLILSGCQSVPVVTGNVDRLLAHPQFKASAKAAPAFTTDALNTVARLEHEINSR